jgi:hypothetical protein
MISAKHFLRTAVFLFVMFAVHSSGQELHFTVKEKYNKADNDFLTPGFHKARRDSLRELMPDSSVAFFSLRPSATALMMWISSTIKTPISII